MIHFQEDTAAIQYTDGKRVNLKLLKNELDRQMLKITLLAQRIPLSEIKYIDVTDPNGPQVTAKQSRQVQTQNIVVTEGKRKSSLKSADRSKFQNNNKKEQQRLIIRERKPLQVKQNDFLICQEDVAQPTTSFENIKLESQVSAVSELEQIPELDFFPKSYRERQSINRASISPINAHKNKKTDRSANTRLSTWRAVASDVSCKPFVYVVSEECKKRVANYIKSIEQRHRKEATDHNLRSNLIKKIEQKFKDNLVEFY